MKKKMFAGMMVAVMVAGMALPVSAEDTTPMTGNVPVSYEESSTFTLSIPSTVSLSENNGTSGTVGLTDINVSTTEKVQIKVTGGIADGAVTLTDRADEDNTCVSTVSLSEGGEGIANDAVIAEFEGSGSNPTPTSGGTLYFTALGDVPAGTYNGTITFQASIEEK